MSKALSDAGTPAVQEWPAVDIVVVSRGRHELLRKAVALVSGVDYPSDKMRIVVIEETDEPQPLAVDGVDYRAIPMRDLGFAHARNEALRCVVAPVVVFTDDDCVVERDWLKEIVGPLVRDQSVQAVAGAVLVPSCGPVGKCENVLGFPGGGLKTLHAADGELVHRKTFSTCNCAVRRDAIEACGGFDERLRIGGEDEALSRRIVANGGVIVFCPSARVLHRPRDGLCRVFLWFIRRGRARAAAIRAGVAEQSAVELLTNSPIVRALVLLALCLLPVVPVVPFVLTIALAYYVFILHRFRWARRHCGIGALLLLPLVKVTMDIGMDFGMLMGMRGEAGRS